MEPVQPETPWRQPARPGSAHSVRVTNDGGTVIFLRSGRDAPADHLWAFDVGTGRERAIFGGGRGVQSYAVAGHTVAMANDGRLVVADLAGVARPFPTTGPVVDPRPDPTGRRVAYLSGGALHVLDRATATSSLLAGEADNPSVAWGTADEAAQSDFGRRRGFWWAPDGESVLATRVDATRLDAAHGEPARPPAPPGPVKADVTLHVLDLDGGWVDVHWDRETYPYLAAVSWSDVGGPLVTVLRRLQQHGLVLAVDPRTGETQVHAELADPRWVGPVPGTPRYLPDGRVLIGGELAHDGYDARCLFADGGLLTPPALYVRRVCGLLGHDLLVEASDGEPSEQHLYRVGARSAASAVDVVRLTTEAGWHRGECGGETVALGSSSLDRDDTEWTILNRGSVVGHLRSYAAPVGSSATAPPRPALERVTDRRLPTGVVYPNGHAGGRLPVLLDCTTLGRQSVIAARAAWTGRQWWADQGFAVVAVDARGTPGIAPSFEKVVHRRLTDVMLTDLIDALAALAEKHTDLDLTRVAVRGHGRAGWLAAMALLRRPDAYRCGVVVDPVLDWHAEPSASAERYLGPPQEASDVYAHNSVLEAAAEPARRREHARPLLLVSTDGALASALADAGRPFAVAADADPSTQVGFIRDHLTAG